MKMVVTGLLVLAVCLAATPAKAQGTTGGLLRRASYTRNIQEMHRGDVQLVGYNGGCCDAAPACGSCGGCASCCVCGPCFPLVRGVLRGVGCVVTRLLRCPCSCGRPVCGPGRCGYDALPWDDGCSSCGGGGCADCGHGGDHYAPQVVPEMMPSPTPANPFQDDPLQTTPSTYHRPVSRTRGCTSCGGVTQTRPTGSMKVATASPPPKKVTQAGFETDSEPVSQAVRPQPLKPAPAPRANYYRR